MKKNVGEVFTIEREGVDGTGYSYYVTRLDGDLAFVNFETIALQSHLLGGPVKYVFTFVGLKPGKAVFQLAKFRVFDISGVLYEEEVTIEILPPKESAGNVSICGGWSEQRPLTKADQLVFDEALDGFVGVEYKPVSVAIQIVAGTNYRFICEATVVYPSAQPYKAMVEIHQPLQGRSVITNISRLP